MKNIDNRGIALALVLSIISVLVLAVTALVVASNNEMKMEGNQSRSTEAFYLAEAGLEKSRTQLNVNWADQSSITGSLGNGTYSANIYDTDTLGASLDPEYLRIQASGDVGGSVRAIEALLRNVNPVAPGTITSAIEIEGTLSVQGNVVVTGDVEQNSVFSFTDTFGVSKTHMEEIAKDYFPGTYYDRPFVNEDSATTITWVNGLGETSSITANGWTGDGIFIINGDLHITGGTFNGVLWVEGALQMSGNPEINGTIFVKSGVTVDTTITGTADITYDPDSIEDAFEGLEGIPPTIESWKEI